MRKNLTIIAILCGLFFLSVIGLALAIKPSPLQPHIFSDTVGRAATITTISAPTINSEPTVTESPSATSQPPVTSPSTSAPPTT